MKLIKIDCCDHCPLRERQNYFDNFCTNSATDGMELTDLSIIHPDCPLEDEKNDDEIFLKSLYQLHDNILNALNKVELGEARRLLAIMEQGLSIALYPEDEKGIEMTEINKEYFEGFGQYIDSLSDEEFMKLLEESGLNDCPLEDLEEEK